MPYAFFDGDEIGPTLQRLLVENRIQEARDFSAAVTEAMHVINTMLGSRLDADVIFSGGDDLLIQVSLGMQSSELVESICDAFYQRTGNTMSCGVGRDIADALWNLHLAKLFGKNQIRGFDSYV